MDERMVAWVAEALAGGLPAARTVEDLVRRGVSELDALDAVSTILADPVLHVARDAVARAVRREAMLATLDELSRLGPSADVGVARRSAMPGEEFLADYYAQNRPVVLEDAADGWAAITRWTPGYLKHVVGDLMLDIAGPDPAAEGSVRPGPRPRITVSFAGFVDTVTSAGYDPRHYLMAESNLLAYPQAQPLLEDFSPDPRYLIPVARADTCRLWLGGPGTVTALHYDPVNVLLVQVVGRKTVRLISPLLTGFVGNSDSVFGDTADPRDLVDVEPDRVHVVDLAPGDALFVPIGWWHHVEAHDVAISLSLTGFRFRNDFRLAAPVSPKPPRDPSGEC